MLKKRTTLNPVLKAFACIALCASTSIAFASQQYQDHVAILGKDVPPTRINLTGRIDSSWPGNSCVGFKPIIYDFDKKTKYAIDLADARKALRIENDPEAYAMAVAIGDVRIKTTAGPIEKCVLKIREDVDAGRLRVVAQQACFTEKTSAGTLYHLYYLMGWSSKIPSDKGIYMYSARISILSTSLGESTTVSISDKRHFTAGTTSSTIALLDKYMLNTASGRSQIEFNKAN